MGRSKKSRFVIVGTDTLRGKELRSVLENRNIRSISVDFFDPNVQEEFSKLTQFKGEARAIQSLTPGSFDHKDVVFLAADEKTNLSLGAQARDEKYLAIDLSGSFNPDRTVPLAVAGVNHDRILDQQPHLIANPHPVSIILSHIIFNLKDDFGLKRILSFILQPASALDEPGIQELADQSVSILSSSSMPKKVFKTQAAFNLISHLDKPDSNGFSPLEAQVQSEIQRIFLDEKLPHSLSFIQAPVFHTYAIMCFFDVEKRASLKNIREKFQNNPFFKMVPSSKTGSVSSVSVAGKNEIYIGQIKKDKAFPDGFWIWTVTDNLTRGSGLNAIDVAENALG